MSKPGHAWRVINTNAYEYRGDVLHGKRHGQGRIHYKNVNAASSVQQYDGEWSNDEFHGKGRQFLFGLGKFEGYFDRGCKCGLGVFKYDPLPSKEEVYVGHFARDVAHGIGYLRW